MTQASASPKPRLIMVYNADSGIIQALMDAVHKQLRPSTYPCSLCALTYGAVSMRGDWKRFLAQLDHDVVFHHRDDFTRAFPALGQGGAREVALPAILLAQPGEEPRVLIAAEQLDMMKDARELMATLAAVLTLWIEESDAKPPARKAGAA